MQKSNTHINDLLFRVVGLLFVLTLMTTCLVFRLNARYIVSDNILDSAHVAGTGIGKLELLEHKANETTTNSGVYQLGNDTVKSNQYEKIIPGVDIPKDPYIEFDLSKSEVTFELYVTVTESNSFPENVTYELTDKWELVDGSTNTYKYKDNIDKDTASPIPILKDDKLYVSEHYVGSGNFSLTFSAYIKQVQTN